MVVVLLCTSEKLMNEARSARDRPVRDRIGKEMDVECC